MLDETTRQWAEAKERWTLAEIRSMNEAGGHFFFSRDTMRFFGDTMSNFRVRHIKGAVYVVRVKRGKNDPRRTAPDEWRRFDKSTGALSVPLETIE